MNKKLIIIILIVVLVIISIFVIVKLKKNSYIETIEEKDFSNVTFEKNEITGNYIVYDENGEILKEDVSESERFVYEDFPNYSPGF